MNTLAKNEFLLMTFSPLIKNMSPQPLTIQSVIAFHNTISRLSLEISDPVDSQKNIEKLLEFYRSEDVRTFIINGDKGFLSKLQKSLKDVLYKNTLSFQHPNVELISLIKEIYSL